tara:strand:- start:28279 stop:28413 length:135 start_codon:yes stop_codon:yes gene_type:complete
LFYRDKFSLERLSSRHFAIFFHYRKPAFFQHFIAQSLIKKMSTI